MLMNMATMTDTKLIKEHEIRSALLRCLTANALTSVVIQEEFRIERGGSRIDVAVIGASFIGYEIKSDLDSFARFSNQIHAYNRVFDQIHLVCGPSHAHLAEEVIPPWWGLQIAERENNGTIQLKVVRHSSDNPKQDSFSLASLLLKDEVIAVLASETKEIPKRASSHVLWECMAKTIPVERIKDAVSKTLLQRHNYNELAVKTI